MNVVVSNVLIGWTEIEEGADESKVSYYYF